MRITPTEKRLADDPRLGLHGFLTLRQAKRLVARGFVLVDQRLIPRDSEPRWYYFRREGDEKSNSSAVGITPARGAAAI